MLKFFLTLGNIIFFGLASLEKLTVELAKNNLDYTKFAYFEGMPIYENRDGEVLKNRQWFSFLFSLQLE